MVDSDPRGWRRTPLHAAAVRGHLRLAEYLIFEHADVNARPRYGDTPLHFALDNGHAEIAASLRKAGANLTLKNDDDEPLLDRARKMGRPGVMSALTQTPE